MKERNSGQAILEYLLMLSSALIIVALVNRGFFRIRNFMWAKITCEVTAPCANCPAPDSVKEKVSRSLRQQCN